MRSSRAQMFMAMAKTAAGRSTCCRLNVGAIVTQYHSPVAMGYNGPPSGEEHCQGNACPLTASGGCSRSDHAEANALKRLPDHSRTDGNMHLYVTHSPCPGCVDKIIASNAIEKVYFETEFRDTSALQKLIQSGIKVYRVTPAGYTIDLATNEIQAE